MKEVGYNFSNLSIGLKYRSELLKKQPGCNSEIFLYTDSKYLKDGITSWIKNWKKNKWITSSKSPVKNRDLWVQLDDLNNTRNISWCWIKAHQDNDNEDYIYNNLADELARSAIK